MGRSFSHEQGRRIYEGLSRVWFYSRSITTLFLIPPEEMDLGASPKGQRPGKGVAVLT